MGLIDDKLKEVKKLYGLNILKNSKRLKAILLDMLGSKYIRHINTIYLISKSFSEYEKENQIENTFDEIKFYNFINFILKSYPIDKNTLIKASAIYLKSMGFNVLVPEVDSFNNNQKDINISSGFFINSIDISHVLNFDISENQNLALFNIKEDKKCILNVFHLTKRKFIFNYKHGINIISAYFDFFSNSIIFLDVAGNIYQSILKNGNTQLKNRELEKIMLRDDTPTSIDKNRSKLAVVDYSNDDIFLWNINKNKILNKIIPFERPINCRVYLNFTNCGKKLIAYRKSTRAYYILNILDIFSGKIVKYVYRSYSENSFINYVTTDINFSSVFVGYEDGSLKIINNVYPCQKTFYFDNSKILYILPYDNEHFIMLQANGTITICKIEINQKTRTTYFSKRIEYDLSLYTLKTISFAKVTKGKVFFNRTNKKISVFGINDNKFLFSEIPVN